MMLYEVVGSLNMTHLREDSRVVEALQFMHNFFASCHGKNLCDALSGMIKSWLTRLEARGVYHRETVSLHMFFGERIDRQPKAVSPDTTTTSEIDEEVDRVTGAAKRADNCGCRRFSTIVSYYVQAGVVDHVFRHDAPVIDGIKSFHSFTQVPGIENKGKVRQHIQGVD